MPRRLISPATVLAQTLRRAGLRVSTQVPSRFPAAHTL